MGFKMVNWTPISGLKRSILEKFGNVLKNDHFSGRIWPDWGNTARAYTAGSIGLSKGAATLRGFTVIVELIFKSFYKSSNTKLAYILFHAYRQFIYNWSIHE